MITSRNLKTGKILTTRGYKIKYLGPSHTRPRWLVNGRWTGYENIAYPTRRKQQAARFSTEEGYFKKMFDKINRTLHQVEFKSWKELLEYWHQQKAVYGMKCPITGDTLTTIRKMEKRNHGARTPTNISPDRLLSSKGYTKQNVLFVTVEWNLAKGPLKGHRVHHLFNSRIANNYLKILRERFSAMEYETE